MGPDPTALSQCQKSGASWKGRGQREGGGGGGEGDREGVGEEGNKVQIQARSY